MMDVLLEYIVDYSIRVFLLSSFYLFIYYYKCFTVTNTEGLTATCAAALGLPNLISRT